MKNKIKKHITIIGLCIFVVIPLFASNLYNIAHGEMFIVKIYNEPVGILSKSTHGSKGCIIGFSISPMMKSSRVNV